MTDAKVPDGRIHHYCFPSLGEPCGNCHRCQPPKPDGGGLSLPEEELVAVIPLGQGDDSDVETGRCCPHCHHSLTEHNVAVWNGGYTVAKRHHAEEVRAARAKALEDAADAMPHGVWSSARIRHWLRERAGGSD